MAERGNDAGPAGLRYWRACRLRGVWETTMSSGVIESGAIDRLRAFQRTVRELLVGSRRQADLHAVSRDSAADTIYQIDALVEPVLEDFCREWARTTPLVLVAEGIEADGR